MGLTGLGYANLANNIASATKGLATAFGLANPEPAFPTYPSQAITAEFQREHWYKNPSQGLYAFSVEEAGAGSISEFPAFINNIKSLFTDFFDSSGGKFGEFSLPITPQEITQVEKFAVTIKPTQGGTVVNHSGNKYKTLTISGTTGVQPFRGVLGAYKGNGLAIGKPDELKYRSGYEVFQHFRRWMESYHETKSKAGSEKLRMLFRNYKDWQFLYVEPIEFTMKRDATKPLLYNYYIQFQVIGVFTLDKPIFDLAVAKLNEISAAVVNTYVLIKKNKSVTESITGVITDFEQSLNNLKMALKSANKQDLKLAEFTQSDSKKLSFKETLQVLNLVGNAMAQAGADTKKAEASGTVVNNSDPIKKAKDLIAKANNPSTITQDSAKAELNALLEAEPALMTTIGLDKLPPAIKADLANKQIKSALISKVEVKNIQAQAQDLSDKLAEGLGLGDSVYNSIFGVTATSTSATQGEVTDDQFEMLYALSRTINSIDGILSSDKLFDTNAALFKKSGATNGADSVGAGIFSLPSANAGYKEGVLPSNITLEQLALMELGSTSRWTEIAELNGLKAPYIVSPLDLLSPNYAVESANFYDPSQIRDLQITNNYLVPTLPVPTGAWSGKGKNIAEFLGGDPESVSSWRFIFPDDNMLVNVVSTLEYLRFVSGVWTEQNPGDFSLDSVLKPGDVIKIPSSTTPPKSTAQQGPRDNPFTNTLSAKEANLGVDLLLTNDLDLDLTPSGDLNVSVGINNGAQAIVLKLLYEKGSLKKYPEIGTNLTPGKKMPDIATVRADVTASLLQDPRIKNVTKINIIQDNSELSLSFEVLFVDVQQPVPITIPI